MCKQYILVTLMQALQLS